MKSCISLRAERRAVGLDELDCSIIRMTLFSSAREGWWPWWAPLFDVFSPIVTIAVVVLAAKDKRRSAIAIGMVDMLCGLVLMLALAFSGQRSHEDNFLVRDFLVMYLAYPTAGGLIGAGLRVLRRRLWVD